MQLLATENGSAKGKGVLEKMTKEQMHKVIDRLTEEQLNKVDAVLEELEGEDQGRGGKSIRGLRVPENGRSTMGK